mgnify:CR=1 FL=1
MRGICCLVPQVVKKSENITVKSIVGRFLEHSRIYAFGEGEDAEVFVSSADFMTRNIERRVEIACPVLDKTIKNKILSMLSVLLADNVKGRMLTSRGKYVKPTVDDGEKYIDSQSIFLSEKQ